MTEKTPAKDDARKTRTGKAKQARPNAINLESNAEIAEWDASIGAVLPIQQALPLANILDTFAKKMLDRDRSGIIAVDRRMTIVYANNSALQKLDFDRCDVLLRTILSALPDNVGLKLERACLETLDIGSQASFEVTPSAGERWEVATESIDGLAIMKIQDISSTTVALRGLRAAYDEILTRSSIDYLTGVRNRSSFFRYVHELSSEMATLEAVLYIDVDNFKQVNDTHGHIAGDHVLKTTALRLAGQCDVDMVIGRVGGDEFVVAVFAGSTEVSTRRHHQLADRMRSACRNPIHLSDGAVTVTVSIGVACSGPGEHELDHMLKAADHALYEQKADMDNVDVGRNA